MINVLKGFIIAVSMLVPGVSGATMMMTLRVYTPTLQFLTALTNRKLVHKRMMLHLSVGALLGLIGFSSIMLWALEHYGTWLRYFFLGSIIYGLYVLVKNIKPSTIKMRHIMLVFFGMISALGLDQFEANQLIQNNPGLFLVLLGGIGIAVALILPGISTSFVLMILGIYEPVLLAIKNGDIPFLLILVVAILIGVLLTARSLVWMIENHFNATMLLIVGFVLGSMWEVVPQGELNILSVGMIILGILIMMGLSKLSVHFDDKE